MVADRHNLGAYAVFAAVLAAAGIPSSLPAQPSPPGPTIIVSDASGWGFGAVCGTRAIMGAWTARERTCWVRGLPRAVPINQRELAAVLMAVFHFAPFLRGRRVLVG